MILNPEMTAKRECSDVLVSGDDAETPQWLGVEVPPGSENMAYLQRFNGNTGDPGRDCREIRRNGRPADQMSRRVTATAGDSERNSGL